MYDMREQNKTRGKKMPVGVRMRRVPGLPAKLFILAFLSLLTLASLSYATSYENQYASMYITPDPVPYAGGSDWQYFQICAKQAGPAHVGYVFDNRLESASAELYGDYLGFENEVYYENVSVLQLVYIDSFTILTAPPPRCDYGVIHPLNKRYINATMQGNSSVYACLNYTQNLGGGLYRIGWWEQHGASRFVPVLKTGYHDITDVFNHAVLTGKVEGKEYNGSHVYYASKTFEADECVTYRIKFKVQPDDPVKYDAVMWGGAIDCWKDDTCAFEALKDPTFNEDAWEFYRNYTLTTEHSPTSMETILLNLSTAEINTSCFMPGYDRWVYVDPNNVSNRTSLSFHYYLTNETNSLSNKYWGVALNMTRPDTPVINGTVLQHYYCNNTAVTNNSNGNLTYFYYESWPIDSTFPNHGWTLGSGNLTVNSTEGGLIVGATGSPTWAYSATIFKANTTLLMKYKSVNTGTAQCIGFHTSTNCGAGDDTMWYLTGTATGAGAKAEGNDYGNAFTTASAISNYPITYLLNRNASASATWGHDNIFRNIIKTATTTSTRFVLFGGSTVTVGQEGYLSFMAVANTSADISWTIGAEAPAISIFMELLSPADANTYSNATVLFNATANSTTRNSYTCNKTIDGTTNNTNYTVVNNGFYGELITYTLGPHVISATCSNLTLTATDSASFIITSFTVLDDNYTGSVYETSSARLNMTIALGSVISNISGSVWFNGTSYIATKLGAGSFSRDVIVPLTQTNGSNVSHTWQFYITYTNGSSAFENSTAKNQNVSFAFLLSNVSYNATLLSEGDPLEVNISLITYANLATIASRVYIGTQSALSGNATYSFHTNTQIPTGGYSAAGAFVNITISYGGVTRNITTANTTINIILLNATNCSSGAYPVLLYLLTDEETLYPLNGTLELTLTLWNKARTASRNISLSNYTAASLSVCLTNTTVVYADSVHMYVNNTGYPTRYHYLINATLDPAAAMQVIPLYLLNDTLADTVVFRVISSSGTSLANAYVVAQRYYQAENAYRSVAMLRTGETGYGNMPLRLIDTLYRFQVYKNFRLQKTTATTTLSCPIASACSITIQLGAGPLIDYLEWSGNIGHSCVYTNTTGTLNCSVSDKSQVSHDYRLLVEEASGLKNIPTCDVTLSAPSGNLVCTGLGSARYTYSLTFSSSPPNLLETGIVNPYTYADMGAMGRILGLVLFLAIGAMGIMIADAFLASIFYTLAFVVLVLLQLIALSELTIGGIIAVGIIIAMKAASNR